MVDHLLLFFFCLCDEKAMPSSHQSFRTELQDETKQSASFRNPGSSIALNGLISWAIYSTDAFNNFFLSDWDNRVTGLQKMQ